MRLPLVQSESLSQITLPGVVGWQPGLAVVCVAVVTVDSGTRYVIKRSLGKQ